MGEEDYSVQDRRVTPAEILRQINSVDIFGDDIASLPDPDVFKKTYVKPMFS